MKTSIPLLLSLFAASALSAQQNITITQTSLKRPYNLQNNQAVETVTFTKLVVGNQYIRVDYDSALTEFSAPVLASETFIWLDNNPSLATIYLPNLTNCNFIGVFGDSSLRAMSLPSLVSCLWLDTQDTGPSLVSAYLPNLRDFGAGLSFTGCPNFSHLDAPNLLVPDGVNLSFYDCSLDEYTVNLLLSRAALNPDCVSGIINLVGARNASPTGQGILDKATLIGRGVTVKTNL